MTDPVALKDTEGWKAIQSRIADYYREQALIHAVADAAMAYMQDGEVKLLDNQRQRASLYDACEALKAFRAGHGAIVPTSGKPPHPAQER